MPSQPHPPTGPTDTPTPFAQTPHLTIRAPTPPDLTRLSALWAHPDTQRTNPKGVVPWGPARRAEVEEFMRDEAEVGFLGILEYRVPHWDVPEEGRGDDAGDVEPGGSTSTSERPGGDTETFVGAVMLLNRYAPKNRDTMFAIQLERRWWGRGFGREATVWMLEYAFAQLGFHRISLHVMGDNERAIRLYKSVGFQDEGHRPNAVWQDGKWMDDVNMGMLYEEWEAWKVTNKFEVDPTRQDLDGTFLGSESPSSIYV